MAGGFVGNKIAGVDVQREAEESEKHSAKNVSKDSIAANQSSLFPQCRVEASRGLIDWLQCI